MKRLMLGMLIGLLLAGCASTVPKSISTPLPRSPTVAAVRTEPESFVGSRVRWGGTIATIENLRTQTLIQVVARDLQQDGRPREGGQSEGRFLARVEGFLDPVVYAKGRSLTVTGKIAEMATRNIGEFPYHLPVVDVESLYLWEPLPELPPYYYYPYFEPSDPFYYRYPWYGYPRW